MSKRPGSLTLPEKRSAAGSPKTPTAGERVPLSALRARVDGFSAGAQWALHPDGGVGRGLIAPAGATVTFGLRLSGEVVFSARAMLLPHDWRDRQGAVRVSVSA